MKPILVLLALVLVSSADEGVQTPACVTSFSAFEKAVLSDGANVEALVKAFYKANHPFPLSVEVVYHVNSSNETDTTISTNPHCSMREEFWLWVPSPVFILIEPTQLNVYALYTLNYFDNIHPSKVNISVPTICNTSTSLNQFNFLNDFTMRVSITVHI